MLFVFFFFFMRKTHYEMRMSDWSSDVGSSDLGRALDGEAARSRGGKWAVIVAKHAGLVAGHGLAGSAGTDVVARGGDEDVHHLGRADAVDDGEAGRVLPGMPGDRKSTRLNSSH